MNLTLDKSNAFLSRRSCILAKRPLISLYHAEVFMPEEAKRAAAKLVFSRLEWSRHAQLELVNDELGMIPAHAVPRCFFGVAWELIELEMTDGVATKYVFRRTVDNRDLIIVLRPLDNGTALVVTCWTNLKTDKHSTLDRSRYDTN